MTATLIDSPTVSSSSGTMVFTGALTGGTGSAGQLDVGWYNGVTISSVVDSRGNTWTIQQTALSYSTDTSFRYARYICERPTGGSGTVTVTFSGNIALGGGYLTEVTGTITSGTITDQAPVGLQDTASPFTSTTTGATAQADELAIACTMTYTSSGTTQVNDWSANGYTALGIHNDTSVWTDGIAYKVLTATGAQTSSLTVSGVTVDAGLTFITTYKVAASGPTYTLALTTFALVITLYSGQSTLQYQLPLTTATLAVATSAVGLTWSGSGATYTLAPTTATLAISTSAVGMVLTLPLQLTTATLAIATSAVGLVWSGAPASYTLPLTTATLAIAAPDVGLILSRPLALTTATLAIATSPIGMVFGWTLPVSRAMLSIGFSPVALVWSGAPPSSNTSWPTLTSWPLHDEWPDFEDWPD